MSFHPNPTLPVPLQDLLRNLALGEQAAAVPAVHDYLVTRADDYRMDHPDRRDPSPPLEAFADWWFEFRNSVLALESAFAGSDAALNAVLAARVAEEYDENAVEAVAPPVVSHGAPGDPDSCGAWVLCWVWAALTTTEWLSRLPAAEWLARAVETAIAAGASSTPLAVTLAFGPRRLEPFPPIIRELMQALAREGYGQYSLPEAVEHWLQDHPDGTVAELLEIESDT